MAENKKVRNATPFEYNGIQFKSLLEVMVYKTLLQEGLEPKYEANTYILWKGFRPTVPFYTRNKKKQHVLNLKKLIDIKLTPDFYLEYKGVKVIIEAKGMENDVFPYKLKLLREYLEKQPDKDRYLLFEIFTKKQLLEAITIIKDYGNSREDKGVSTSST